MLHPGSPSLLGAHGAALAARTKEGAVMKVVRLVCLALPLSLSISGCEHKQTRVADVEPPPRPEVIEAHWVTGPELDRAVLEAAATPLVKQVIEENVDPRLTPMWHLAVKATGRILDGRTIGVTMLPYMVDGDPMHARFLSYIDDGMGPYAEPSDLILGREPTSLETGFVPVDLGGRIGYVRSGATYKMAASGLVQRSAERRNWIKFADCFFDAAPGYCATGSALAEEIAPGVPRAGAIGCGAGIAVAAITCAAQHLL
jgi:hypothetical protein